MSFREDFLRDINEGLEARTSGLDMRPTIEVWPVDDDFGLWVASHGDRARAVICSTPEYKDSPFCGTGVH